MYQMPFGAEDYWMLCYLSLFVLALTFLFSSQEHSGSAGLLQAELPAAVPMV
jgi:hypothetical protein